MLGMVLIHNRYWSYVRTNLAHDLGHHRAKPATKVASFCRAQFKLCILPGFQEPPGSKVGRGLAHHLSEPQWDFMGCYGILIIMK